MVSWIHRFMRSDPIIARLGSSLLLVAFSASCISRLREANPPDAPDATSPPSVSEFINVSPEAIRIHGTSLVFDGHNDLPWALRTRADSSFDELDIGKPQPELHTDIPRLRGGGLGAQFWSVYVPAKTEHSGAALLQTIEQIDLVHRMIARYPETFEFATTAADVVRIRRAGKIASLLGIEGGYSIENSLAALRMLSALGVRYMTLTHADTTAWADSATDEPQHDGLSSFGEEVVRQMNDLGMLIDISHVSVETMRDVLALSRAPVIASHSSAYSVAAHPRNIPDEILRGVADNGGVIMVNFYSGFVVPESARVLAEVFNVRRDLHAQFPDEAQFDAAMSAWHAEHPIEAGTADDVVDHIDHIVRVAGIDHVGLGSDYDGVSLLPRGLEDVSTYPVLTQIMLDRGYGEDDIRKVLGLNALRVLSQAEVAAKGSAEE